MILDTIVARKREEVAALRSAGIRLPEQFREKHLDPPRGFHRALECRFSAGSHWSQL